MLRIENLDIYHMTSKTINQKQNYPYFSSFLPWLQVYFSFNTLSHCRYLLTHCWFLMTTTLIMELHSILTTRTIIGLRTEGGPHLVYVIKNSHTVLTVLTIRLRTSESLTWPGSCSSHNTLLHTWQPGQHWLVRGENTSCLEIKLSSQGYLDKRDSSGILDMEDDKAIHYKQDYGDILGKDDNKAKLYRGY